MDRQEALKKLEESRFYGIVDTGYVDSSEMISATRELCEGGVGILQLRAKGVDLGTVKEWAVQMQLVCHEFGVVFVLNDYPEMAAELGCDAVHIGQDDGDLAGVRAIVGSEVLVGRSTHSKEQAIGAREEGFDYIGFGPLFPTPTKKGRPGIGMENIVAVEELVGSHIPVFCIGGVKEENLSEVLDAGAKRVVIVSDVLTDQDRTKKVSRIIQVLLESVE